MKRIDELKHFLAVEVQISKNRKTTMTEKPSPFYDGVYVGIEQAEKLMDSHIRFCEKLIAMIDGD